METAITQTLLTSSRGIRPLQNMDFQSKNKVGIHFGICLKIRIDDVLSAPYFSRPGMNIKSGGKFCQSGLVSIQQNLKIFLEN